MSEAASSSISQHQGHGAVNDVLALTLQSLAFGVYEVILPADQSIKLDGFKAFIFCFCPSECIR